MANDAIIQLEKENQILKERVSRLETKLQLKTSQELETKAAVCQTCEASKAKKLERANKAKSAV